MKKLLLFSLTAAFGWASFAQSPYKNLKVHPAVANKTAKATKRLVYDQSAQQKSNNSASVAKAQKSLPGKSLQLTETLIGTTTYDLQTNGSTGNRIVYNNNGTVQSTWTFSTQMNTTWSDRGTGYNDFDGTSWGPQPTVSIEAPTRTGWGEIMTLGNGGEVVISHAPAAASLMICTRNPYGSGTWDVSALSELAPLSILWPRAVAGGPDGNTIHLIAHNEQQVVVEGVSGMVSYSRSLDGGLTWDIKNLQLPGFDTSNYAYLSADDYAIDCKGNTVAVALFGQLSRTLLIKSTDNGNTWTSQMVFDMPFIYDPNSSNTSGPVIGISDMNGDEIPDTVTSTDGTGALILDNNGTAHLFWGMMRFLDDVAGDGSWSYFPYTDGIGYWNENMKNIEPQPIAWALDVDGSGTLLDEAANGIELATYYTSLTSQPHAGVDASGCIYVVYSGVVETLNSGSQFYRHIYAVRSCDGGCSWSYPIDMTNSGDYDFLECVYPSMAHNVGSKFHFIFQRDPEPGVNLQGDEDPVILNEIMHIKEDVLRLDTVKMACVGGIMAPYTTFCSGDSVLLTATCGNSWNWSTGETTQSIYAKNFTTYTCTINTECGYSIVDDVTLSAVSTGPTVTISASANSACPNDQVILTTNSVSNATWLWSNGDTTQSTTVTGSGTYTVTVTNCGGSTTKSITIGSPSLPPATITGTSTMCSGDSVQLEATTGANLTYQWSTGATTPSIFVNTPGTYSVTVTNCVGDSSASFTVSTTPAPSANITPFGPTTFCEGGTVSLNASGAGTGGSYVWSTGQTTALITVNSTGSYTVTAFNVCGDSAVSSPVNVTVNPAPIVPSVQTFTQGSQWGFTCNGCDSLGTLQWYLNGIAMPGQTDDTLLAEWNVIGNGSVTLKVTDANGCSSTTPNVNVFVGVQEQRRSNLISIYPNPNNGRFVVNFSNAKNDNYTLNLKNILGQTVLSRKLNIEGDYNMFIDLSRFNAGMYFLTISNSNGEQTHKVVVK